MPLVLLFLFLLLPILELYVIIQVGQAIGLVPTLFLLILDGFAGAALARSQGRNAWARVNRALAEGRMPARETLDGGMIVLGGALLLAPGFITDIVGFALLVPPTRALLRGLVVRLARRRTSFAWTVGGGPASGPQPPRSYDFEGSAREVTDPPPELEDKR